MALHRNTLLLYTLLLVIFVSVFTLYSVTCNCNNCGTQSAEHSSFYRQNRDVDESLTNVEALNELLHRSQQRADNDKSPLAPIAASKHALPTVFMITPTYKRLTQKADLTRLCQTLMHVDKLEWIVVEDSLKKTKLVLDFLDKCKVSSVHLFVKTSENFTNVPIKMGDGKLYYGVKKPRGIEQRNRALDWIRQTYQHRNIKGVVYFADDDNTYDLSIFNEMRHTKSVSVWPVGLAGGLKYEGPKCSKTEVTGWYSYWATDRTFRVDFAGFAVNLDLLMNNKYIIPVDSKPGYVEDAFLVQFAKVKDLEPKAKQCTKIFVWHTRTEKPSMLYENQLVKMGYPSSNKIEV